MNEIEKLANKLGKKYKTFDPFLIAEKENIDIQYKDFENEPLGQSISYFNRPIILLSLNIIDSNKKYFVCAHELCHALKHTELSTYYISNCNVKNKFEYQADKFAFTLLKNLYKEQYETEDITTNYLTIAYGIKPIG
ncbi:ImmA/IrrE family metallo-endopeptidase (plasmid) [Fructilactobacillus vespulae]|uniref:ImmA/IrrE family metallo-endopeptidase n=1 Tax=Fructilactobacillus vespulae TaxID=1249630 RepID=UPI0039B5864A